MMFEAVLLNLAIAFPTLITLYWICMIVGGGLLVISTFLGGHHDGAGDFDMDVGGNIDLGGDIDVGGDVDLGGDLSVDAHVDADVGVDADVSTDGGAGFDVGHAHAMSLASWFSIRFVTYFMAAFGVVGVVLTHMSQLGTGATAAWALLAGLVVGQCVHQIMRGLSRSSGNSALRPQDYINKIARVTVTITYPRKGEVAVPVIRGKRFVPAIAKRANAKFNIGDQVAVIAYRGGIAEVISREEYEFLTSNEKGGSK